MFTGCWSLTSINVSSDNNYYSSSDGVLYNKNKTELICCPGGKKALTIPNSVTSIGDWAFEECSSLTSITIPNSVTSIGHWAFEDCSSLTSITIPNSVTSFDNRMFLGCTSLTSINVNSDNKNYSSLDGVLYNKNKTVLIRCPQGKTSIVIPKSVTSIDAFSFEYCGFTSITIPDGVTSIGEYAFQWCQELKSITIPDSVTQIDSGSFLSCNDLTIKCTPGSYAESYAKKYDFPYRDKNVPDTTNLSKLTATVDKTVFGYTGKAKAPTVTIKDGSYTLKQGTDYTLSYKNNKNIGTGTITVTGKGNYTGTKNLSFTIIPSNVGGLKAASTSASAVKLSWNKVSGAGGYIVYQYNNSTKKWVRIAKTGNVNTYTVKSLKAGTTYKYAVKAYKTVSGKDYASAKYPTITTSTKPAKVSFKAAAASKAVKFSWSKVAGATNYIVYYRVKGTSAWKSVKVANNVTSRTISGLVKGKTYEVTVKAVRTVNKVNYNGAYDVKTVKVK